MRIETQQALLRRVADHLQAGTTDMAEHSLRVPARHYVDDSQTRAEIDALFRRRPLLAALTPDLPDPGAYVAIDLADVAVLLVRDDGGRARAFVNACRHRGARIAEGRGHARSFSCPFHAWNWSREGRLIARPNSCDGFDDVGDGFDTLVELACRERAGMVFVQVENGDADGDADGDIDAQLDALIGDITDEIEGYGIAATRRFGGRDTERACNYKLIIDGFTEPYHIPALHKATIAPYYFAHPALVDTFGPVGRMIGVRSSVTKEFDRPEAERRFLRHGTTQYLLPPNAVLVHQVDHIQFWQVHPVDGAADRCRIELNLYWPEPVDAEAERKAQFNLDVLWKVITEEDMPQSLGIHRNLASGALPELVFGRNEPALIHYHRQIAAAIGSDALRDCD
ncbi:MAG TPA: aromatic ring-hydroxylating dioxygenase subunit alpha [Pseudomonadales bacterium]|nr:aromatic ring-hydroxylating dioxygenase subunit alpha [Pseudomonadales bacterium]